MNWGFNVCILLIKEGRILLDDTNISQLDPSWLRKQIALVSQA
jgi:ABC-type multidrug transport system fused ATPase/permease subunit